MLDQACPSEIRGSAPQQARGQSHDLGTPHQMRRLELADRAQGFPLLIELGHAREGGADVGEGRPAALDGGLDQDLHIRGVAGLELVVDAALARWHGHRDAARPTPARQVLFVFRAEQPVGAQRLAFQGREDGVAAVARRVHGGPRSQRDPPGTTDLDDSGRTGRQDNGFFDPHGVAAGGLPADGVEVYQRAPHQQGRVQLPHADHGVAARSPLHLQRGDGIGGRRELAALAGPERQLRDVATPGRGVSLGGFTPPIQLHRPADPDLHDAPGGRRRKQQAVVGAIRQAHAHAASPGLDGGLGRIQLQQAPAVAGLLHQPGRVRVELHLGFWQPVAGQDSAGGQQEAEEAHGASSARVVRMEPRSARSSASLLSTERAGRLSSRWRKRASLPTTRPWTLVRPASSGTMSPSARGP